MIGSDLFARTLSFDYGDSDRSNLMEEVWSVTPWMINVRTGSPTSDEYRAIMDWCHENIGDEAWPIHGRPGQWQSGGATVFGETFMGFATEDLMNQFTAAFPSSIVSPPQGTAVPETARLGA